MPKLPVDWLSRSRLNARQLSLLVQLEEKGSVLEAATAVHMTQPAASRVLQSLEQALGVPLFERHARGVIPTPYGKALVRRVRSALAELKQAHAEVEALASGMTGEVRIGSVIAPAADLVPMAVARLLAQHPRVRVAVELGFSEALIQQLMERKLDIVIARLHASHKLSGLEFEALGEETHGLFVHSAHPLLRKGKLTLAETAAHTWVLPPPGNVMRDRLTVLFLQLGIAFPSQVVETSALPVITNLLRVSDMVAPLGINVVQPYVDSGMLKKLPVALTLQLGAAGIVTHRGVELSLGAAALLKELRTVAAQLYARHASRKGKASKR